MEIPELQEIMEEMVESFDSDDFEREGMNLGKEILGFATDQIQRTPTDLRHEGFHEHVVEMYTEATNESEEKLTTLYHLIMLSFALDNVSKMISNKMVEVLMERELQKKMKADDDPVDGLMSLLGKVLKS